MVLCVLGGAYYMDGCLSVCPLNWNLSLQVNVNVPPSSYVPLTLPLGSGTWGQTPWKVRRSQGNTLRPPGYGSPVEDTCT